MGEVARFKAHIVGHGYTQRYSVDFDEVFVPVIPHAMLEEENPLEIKDEQDDRKDVPASAHESTTRRRRSMLPKPFEDYLGRYSRSQRTTMKR